LFLIKQKPISLTEVYNGVARECNEVCQLSLIKAAPFIHGDLLLQSWLQNGLINLNSIL